MNYKLFGTIFIALLILGFTAGRTIRLYETIFKANGDRIIRNWTMYDGDDCALENRNDLENSADDDDVLSTATLLKHFGCKNIGQKKKLTEHTQPKIYGNQTLPETQKQVAGKQTSPNGLHMERTYRIEPMPGLSTNNYNQENSPQNHLQYEAKHSHIPTIKKTLDDSDEKFSQETDYYDIPLQSVETLDEFLDIILGKEKASPTTSVEPIATKISIKTQLKILPEPSEADIHRSESENFIRQEFIR